MYRKIILTVLAVTLGVLGVTALSAGHASARASCSIGSWNTNVHPSAPGNAALWWTKNSTPTTCESLRVRIESSDKLYYEGKWIHYTGDGTSSAGTGKDPLDRTALLKASVEREPTGNGSKCQIREFWPAAGKWVNCPSAAHTTAAAGVSVTHTAARVKASRPGTGPRFFAFGDSKLYGSIQGPVRASGTSVACNSGQNSDPCEAAGWVYGGYYLHTPAGYVLHCTFGACPGVAHSLPALKAAVNRAVEAICPGNTVNWKADQTWAKWAVQWNDRPTVCAIRAAMLWRNVHLNPKTKWRRGDWKQQNKTWSKVGAASAPGYSGCKGDIQISTSGKDRDYAYTTAYLWPQCANPPAHLARVVVHSGKGSVTIQGCARKYDWATGYTPGGNGQPTPYAMAKWTSDPNSCGFWIQTRVYASHGCPAEGHSGPVQRNNLWAVAHGTLGLVHLCFGAVHFRTNVQGSKWTNWQRIGDPSNITTMAVCSAECISWHHHSYGNGRSLFQSWWTQNRYGMQQRARAHCVNPGTGQGHYNLGSWKVNLNDRSQATCYKPYVMTFGCYQQRAMSGSPTGTTCPYHPGAVVRTMALVKPMATRTCNLANDHWKAQWGRHVDTQPYIWIEWTANPCGQQAQSSIACHDNLTGENQTNLSGPVKKVGLKAEADCMLSWQPLACFKRLTKADGSWGPWTTVCTFAGNGVRPWAASGGGGTGRRNATRGSAGPI